MNILLLGYGKMGKTIEKIATDRGHTIKHIIDMDNRADLQTIKKGDVDVAIEFSQPSAAVNNISYCLNNGIPIVVGTTGWLDKQEEIEALCKNNDGTFLYASNFSIGVNITFKINQILAKLMNNYQDYDVKMEEIHHTEKKDAPSGTAVTLAEGILEGFTKKQNWVNEITSAEDKLGIESLRIGKTPGTHTVTYSSAIDEIELKHTAHGREGFALGSVVVAEWIKDKRGVLTMDDFFNFKF